MSLLFVFFFFSSVLLFCLSFHSLQRLLLLLRFLFFFFYFFFHKCITLFFHFTPFQTLTRSSKTKGTKKIKQARESFLGPSWWRRRNKGIFRQSSVGIPDIRSRQTASNHAADEPWAGADSCPLESPWPTSFRHEIRDRRIPIPSKTYPLLLKGRCRREPLRIPSCETFSFHQLAFPFGVPPRLSSSVHLVTSSLWVRSICSNILTSRWNCIPALYFFWRPCKCISKLRSMPRRRPWSINQ